VRRERAVVRPAGKRSWKIWLPWKLWYPPIARIFHESPIFYAKFRNAGQPPGMAALGAATSLSRLGVKHSPRSLPAFLRWGLSIAAGALMLGVLAAPTPAHASEWLRNVAAAPCGGDPSR
jgi:hypothetical protein